MKKTFFLLLSLIMACGTTLAETRQVVLLLHNGSGRQFEMDQLQQAVDAAEDRDTICLIDGIYPVVGDTLTIGKPVSIIGSGVNTKIMGTINISIPDSVTLSSYLLDALRVTGNVRVQQPVNGLRYRKCTFDTGIVWNATARDVLVDRCNVNTFGSTPLLKSANVVNSRITVQDASSLSPDNTNFGNSVTFINCAIWGIKLPGFDYGPYEYSTYINCIVYNLHRSYSHWRVGESISNCIFINSLLFTRTDGTNDGGFDYGTATQIDCYSTSESALRNWNYISGCSLSAEEMIERGWLGNDGIVVGPEGGHAPYSLIPTGISVRESWLTIDGENRTLNVRLKLTAN